MIDTGNTYFHVRERAKVIQSVVSFSTNHANIYCYKIRGREMVGRVFAYYEDLSSAAPIEQQIYISNLVTLQSIDSNRYLLS
jgi:hypothetical protein